MVLVLLGFCGFAFNCLSGSYGRYIGYLMLNLSIAHSITLYYGNTGSFKQGPHGVYGLTARKAHANDKTFGWAYFNACKKDALILPYISDVSYYAKINHIDMGLQHVADFCGWEQNSVVFLVALGRLKTQID